jgi:hypothetical protein
VPAIVTFDPVNLLIEEIGVGGDNELDLVEIYSEWKDWVKLSDNAKYYPAFRFVGGDPITDTQDLGITYFLLNGWRIKPAELSHKLTVVGNLFTDPSGFSAFVDTNGAFTVNTETRVSNLVDSAVSRLDLTQLLTEVYIDPINGVSGTAEGVGTPTNPVNNVIDARTIADRDNLSAYAFIGSISIGAVDHENWSFRGLSAQDNDILTVAGASVTHARFSSCVITGSLTGRIDASNCQLDVVSGLDGTFDDCGFVANFALADNSVCGFHNCYSLVPGTSTPMCVFGANANAQFRDYSGGIEIQGMTAGCVASVDLDPGHLIVAADCVGGTILVRGIGRVTNLSSLDIIDLGFLTSEQFSETHISVAYDGTTMEIGTWLERRGSTVIAPISTQVDWYESDGTLLFTETSSSPDVRGHFEITRVQALAGNEGYYAIVQVTDIEGTVVTRRGVPTVGP